MAKESGEAVEMRICDSRRVAELIDIGELRVVSENTGIAMLDDFRIGLHVQDSVKFISDTVDLSRTVAPPLETRSLFSRGMRRGEWVLGHSSERISLSRRLIGFLNTRSKYARVGLELMSSSWLVAPGFGAIEPTRIVFEMRAHADLVGFRADECYAYFFLFELDQPIDGDDRDYSARFPLSHRSALSTGG